MTENHSRDTGGGRSSVDGGLGLAGRACLTLLCLLILPGAASARQARTRRAGPGVIPRYIGALERRDYKTVINLTDYYRGQINNIKARNPRVLWPKLIGEYVQRTIPRFLQAPSGGAAFLAMSMAMMGDPTQNIRTALALLPPSCRWSISETRRGPNQETVYVTVHYPLIAQAPIIGARVLRQTILQFTLSRATGLVDSVAMVSQANTFWDGGPAVRTEMASRFYTAGRWQESISLLEPLKSRNALSKAGLNVLANSDYEYVVHQCFSSTANLNVSGYPRYPKFTGGQRCLPDMKEAVQLMPSLGEELAASLLSDSEASLRASALGSASSELGMAKEYVNGNQQLAARAARLGIETSRRWLHLALYNYASQGNGDSKWVKGQVQGAVQLEPDIMRSGLALGVVEDCLKEAGSDRARGDIFGSNDYFFGILDFMKEFGIPLPSQDVPGFLQWAGQTRYPAKWRREVEALASGGPGVVEGGNQPVSSEPVGHAAGQLSPPAAERTAACGDFQQCMQAGMGAFHSSNWSAAVSDFQSAAGLQPSSVAPWGWMSSAFLRTGQIGNLTHAYDKILTLGGTILVPACHELSFRPCDEGVLSMSASSIAFRDVRKRTVVTVSPSGVRPKGTQYNPLTQSDSFGLRAGGRNYNFDFVPYNAGCRRQLFIQCPAGGIAQQSAVGKYVEQTIPKLASGGFVPPATATSGSAPAPKTSGTPTASANTAPCGQTVSAGYSILANGRLYTAKTAITSAGRIPVFFDEKGAPVLDATLLRTLELGAWTRDTIVASASTRAEIAGKLHTLPDMISTSQALQGYQAVQDVLARAMAESIEAAVTGGASLSKAVPNLAWGVVREQLSQSPRTVLIVAARTGLQNSLADYKQLTQGVLPPANSNALDITTLEQVRTLFIQAQSVDIPNEALASALMPTSGLDLTNEALQSVVSELLPGLPSKGAVVTLSGLLDFQKSLAQAGRTLPALQKYDQDLNLELDLWKADDHKLDTLTTQAAAVCRFSSSGATSSSQR